MRFFFFSSRRRHTTSYGDWSSDVCSSDLVFAGLTIWLVRTAQEALAWVALFCLVMGMMVSYAKARAEGLGIPCNVGRSEERRVGRGRSGRRGEAGGE